MAVYCQFIIQFLAPKKLFCPRRYQIEAWSETPEEDIRARRSFTSRRPFMPLMKGIVERGFRMWNWKRLGNYLLFVFFEDWIIQNIQASYASCYRPLFQTACLNNRLPGKISTLYWAIHCCLVPGFEHMMWTWEICWALASHVVMRFQRRGNFAAASESLLASADWVCVTKTATVAWQKGRVAHFVGRCSWDTADTFRVFMVFVDGSGNFHMQFQALLQKSVFTLHCMELIHMMCSCIYNYIYIYTYYI